MNISAYAWSHPPSYEAARARLIGRRKYHDWLKQAAKARREVVVLLLFQYGWNTPKVCHRIAAELGCGRSTITKDRLILRQEWARW